MKVSILGAGWLGFPLGNKLLKSGYQVNGSTTSTEKLDVIRSSGMIPHLIKLDQNIDFEALKAFCEVDVLVITLPPGRRYPDVLENYTKRIQLILSVLHPPSLQGIIYTSSTSVYGNIEGICTEQSPINPLTASAKAVRQAEQMLLNSSIPLTILRFGGLAGENRKAGRFLAGKKDLPDGDAPVNLVHQLDCIHIMEMLIEKRTFGELFNVCAPLHPSRSETYIKQAEKLGLEVPTFISKKTKPYKIISAQKLTDHLDYEWRHPNPLNF
ncbi:MAG: SDR family oxidoreductase [Bacteroidota bacterium]